MRALHGEQSEEEEDDKFFTREDHYVVGSRLMWDTLVGARFAQHSALLRVADSAF